MLFWYVYIIDQETAHGRPIMRDEMYGATHMNKDNVPFDEVSEENMVICSLTSYMVCTY
jgi:hypothetical protein